MMSLSSRFLILFGLLAITSTAQYNYTKGDADSGDTFTAPGKYKTVALSDATFKPGKRPMNVIVMIGDGMGAAQAYAAYTANGGALNMFNMPYTGFSCTQSSNNYITDSAAGGTALSCGVRTKNGAIGVDSTGKALRNISEILSQRRKSIGMVATSSITHATPASFVAHAASRNSEEDIAVDFVHSQVDVFIGGGRKFFINRTDKINYTDSLKTYGFSVFDHIADAKGAKVAVFTSDEANAQYPKRGEILPEATKKAIDLLNRNKKGFFLMVEGSQIDWGCHANNLLFAVNEALDFDRAIGKALEFAKKDGNTLVIVTADHETGGMALTGGNFGKGMIKAAWTTKDHTAIMVPVYAYGPGAERFTGVYNNTAIFDKIMKVVK